MLSLGKKIDSFKKKCFFIETGPYWAILSLMDREVRAGNARRSRGPIRAPRTTCVQKEKNKINNGNHDLFFAIYGYKLGETRNEAVFLIFSVGGLVVGTPPCLKHLLERSGAENDDDFASPVASSFHLFSQIRLWQIAGS